MTTQLERRNQVRLSRYLRYVRDDLNDLINELADFDDAPEWAGILATIEALEGQYLAFAKDVCRDVQFALNIDKGVSL